MRTSSLSHCNGTHEQKGQEKHLYTSFQYFDKESSGYITDEELEHALQEQKLYGAEKHMHAVSKRHVRSKNQQVTLLVAAAKIKKGCWSPPPQPPPNSSRSPSSQSQALTSSWTTRKET